MLHIMRTTLNIDSEVMAKIRQLSRQRQVPLGTVVSDLVRAALEPATQAPERNGVPVFPPGDGPQPGLDLVNRLRD